MHPSLSKLLVKLRSMYGSDTFHQDSPNDQQYYQDHIPQQKSRSHESIYELRQTQHRYQTRTESHCRMVTSSSDSCLGDSLYLPQMNAAHHYRHHHQGESQLPSLKKKKSVRFSNQMVVVEFISRSSLVE
jgi:hypothetical protein